MGAVLLSSEKLARLIHTRYTSEWEPNRRKL